MRSMGKCRLCKKPEVLGSECAIQNCKYLVCQTCSATNVRDLVLEHHNFSEFDDIGVSDYTKWLKALTHLSNCGGHCHAHECLRTRALMDEIKGCNVGIQGECIKCKKIWIGLCAHASHCTTVNCRIPYCKSISEFKRLGNA